MASTFQTTDVANGEPARAGIGVTSVTKTYAVLAALVINDVIQMIKVPAGAVILDMILEADDLDDGTAIVLDVGDGSDTGRFIDGSTIAQAGGMGRMDQAGGVGYEYSAEDTIDVLVETAPTTGTTGNITLSVIYTLDK